MSRPKPTILIEKVDKDYKTDQVLASEGIWAVFYKEQPINLKSFNALIGYASPKYKKVSFSNPMNYNLLFISFKFKAMKCSQYANKE